MTRNLAIVATLAWLSACGPSFIVLEVSSSLRITQEVNSIQVTTFDARQLGDVLSDVELVLDDGQTFPIEVLLQPSDNTPSQIREQVIAYLDGIPVAQNEVQYTWIPHNTNRAYIELELLD
jgi:hypothetical protein